MPNNKLNKAFQIFLCAGLVCEKNEENLTLFEDTLADLERCIEENEILFVLNKATRDLLKGGKLMGGGR